MRAAPPIGYNLTYSCPEGMVFDHDWFATPFVMMTCKVTRHQQPAASIVIPALFQDDGVFDEPDWDTFSCVFRE